MERFEQEITSLKEYIDYITELRKYSLTLGDNKKHWFFRGQKNVSWPVTPVAFRGDLLVNEKALINSALRKNPLELRDSAPFDTLTKLQHYGLGTRLLDVTLNPLVALYFACEICIEHVVESKSANDDLLYKKDNMNGCIYYKYADWQIPSDMEIRIATHMSFIDISPEMTLAKICEQLADENVINENFKARLIKDNYWELIRIIQTNYFVIPENSNERLTRQAGAFVFPCAINISWKDDDIKNCLLCKACCDLQTEFEETILIVPHDNKEDILKELDFVGINRSTLFPELEHQMGYLKETIRTSSGQIPDFTPFSSENDHQKEEKLPPTEKLIPITEILDINEFITSLLGDLDTTVKANIEKAILETSQQIDWYKKDSALSSLKLQLKRINALTNKQKRVAEQLPNKIAQKYISKLNKLKDNKE